MYLLILEYLIKVKYTIYVMKKIYGILFLLLYSIQGWTQETPNGFYAYTLENGLDIYVQEDFTIPTMRIEYVSKAGTGRQNKDTTGFYQLYSRLFWKNSVSSESAYDSLGAGEFTSQTGFSQSRYSFVIPSVNFDEGMKVFSNDLKHTQFTDKDISVEFNQLKQEVTAWSSSIPGFINASIDATIFADEPWTKDSGVYPALFSSNTIENVRRHLTEISNNWYVPDQSALFISGPISAETTLSIVKKYLSSWQSSYVIGTSSHVSTATSARKTDSEKNKLFVLVSNDFSKDYIQAVLQYTAPGLGANNKYSATSWTAAEIMQTKLLQAGMSNTNTSFVADASDSRIIIQTLFDAQSVREDSDISVMLPGFSNIVKSTARLISENDLNQAKHRALLFRNDAYTGSDNFMEAVAANWAYGGVDYFFDWPKAVQEVTLDDVKQSFNDPWIFVLVHTDLYSKNSENFENFGYTKITEDTGAWYAENDSLQQDTQEKLQVLPDSSIQEYTEFTKSLLTEYTLSSGIPVVTQNIPSTPWVSLLITIDGGEVLQGGLKRATEQIAIENLSNIIEQNLTNSYFEEKLKTVPIIENETELYSSYISILSLYEDLDYVLEVVSSAIQETIITIPTADELFISSAYNWQIKSGDLDYQLYAAGMETLYGGTPLEGLFNSNVELMLQADYKDIRLASELIYDPNRISFVLTGGFDKNLQKELERHFGKSFYPIEREYKATIIDEQAPIFSPLEQVVRLRHTFLTDVPASLAGERPTKLIPTTDFSDPAHLYFKVPAFNDTEHALFVALLYEVADRLKEGFSDYRTPPALGVSVVPGTGAHPVSSLRFSKVKSRENLKQLVQDTFNELVKDLQNSNKELLGLIQSRYTRVLSREMLTLTDRAHLIQQGIRSSSNPALYVEKYDVVLNASSEQYQGVFKDFLDEGEFFWLFSADTAR